MQGEKTTDRKKRLLVAAAGTGGHVMPGIAVAREMRRRGWEVSWIGTQAGMEGGLVAKDGIPFHGLDFKGVRGKGPLGMAQGAVKLWLASREARRLIAGAQPDVIFTTGGYVAVPVSWGAKKLGRKVAVMNCDADLLMSTHMILKQAWGVACGFAGSARSAAGAKGRITGNPVRADIAAVEAPQPRLAGREGNLRLFVFGGSLGAQVLNETVPRALALFPAANRPEVLHQCGRGNKDKVEALYRELGVEGRVTEFIDDMAACYAWSDLVLCRAGATSVAELCAAGAASVLVPFIAKTTRHQEGNARYMQRNGAALWLPQEQLTPEHLLGLLMSTSREKIVEMAVKARAISRENAAGAVADMIEEIDAMRSKP
ncbi:MAG: undecaprenyldiphospho-muramoylpentapeptide beta-N-acetylglucosaminyltransferase [Duodenibacillus sp.]|nr:undecaprenyldiphospho-muramoylpentapeptide beta-N-acetylglucosaminyltransferase [Duodenibacillus sp.]